MGATAVCATTIAITCNGMQFYAPTTNTYNQNTLQFQATPAESNFAFHVLQRVWNGKGKVTSPTTLNFQFFCNNLRVTRNCEGVIASYDGGWDSQWPLDLFELQQLTTIWGPLFQPGTLPTSRFPLTVMPQYGTQQHDP